MIPKIIHYCWFGQNQKSGLILKCIESWKKYCPEYEIVEWNEENFNINICQYTREAYEANRWAFVSDYARLYALYTVGGIYLDTDVELTKNLDVFLKHKAFTGFESKDCPITAVMGAEQGNKVIKDLLDEYEGRSFLKKDGTYDMTTNTITITKYFSSKGIRLNGKGQQYNGFVIYPQIMFCPNDISRVWNGVSSKTYAIHHFDQSWKNEAIENKSFKYRIVRYIKGVIRNIMGTEFLLNHRRDHDK